MYDARGVVRMECGDEAALRVDAQVGGHGGLLAIDVDEELGVDVEGDVALLREVEHGQTLRQVAVLGLPRRLTCLEPRGVQLGVAAAGAGAAVAAAAPA